MKYLISFRVSGDVAAMFYKRILTQLSQLQVSYQSLTIFLKRPFPDYMGYSFWLAVRVLLYAPSHRQDSTYHSLCYTSRGALAWMRNSPVGPPWGIELTSHRIMSECSYHRATSRFIQKPFNGYTVLNTLFYSYTASDICRTSQIEWKLTVTNS